MKKILIAFLLAARAFIAQGDTYATTAKLPGDRMIWPPVEFSAVADGILISGEFIESKSILVVEQGNWEEHTYMVKYNITKGHPQYPHKELSFIVVRSWPTAESGIKLKALDYHFRAGNMDFMVQKDEDVRSMDYFKIGAYKSSGLEPTLPPDHRD